MIGSAPRTQGGTGSDPTIRGDQAMQTPTIPRRRRRATERRRRVPGWVLGTLILVAVVANLNLAVANVALPDIGAAFRASQTALDLVSVGFSVGLAGTVLYFGALGDRYGRKTMLLLGTFARHPDVAAGGLCTGVGVLIVARVLGGVAAGMAFPTTLALITALWTGPRRTTPSPCGRPSGVRGRPRAVPGGPGPALVLVGLVLPAHAAPRRRGPGARLEARPGPRPRDDRPGRPPGGRPVDRRHRRPHHGHQLRPDPRRGRTGAHHRRGRRSWPWQGSSSASARRPTRCSTSTIAGRRIFWVAAVGGLIVFGSLMGAIFIGLQFLQNVMGYSTLRSGAAVIPAAVCMMLVAPQSAKLIDRLGSRTHPPDRLRVLPGRVRGDARDLDRALVARRRDPGLRPGRRRRRAGRAPPPRTRSPARSRSGASAWPRRTSDLQRDLGGSIMQSLLGAILTATYASDLAKTARVTPDLSNNVAATIERSYASAAAVAQQYPAHAPQIISAARSSFLTGSNWAYLAGCVAIVVGGVVVGVYFPRKDDEARLLDEYAEADATADAVVDQAVGDGPDRPGGPGIDAAGLTIALGRGEDHDMADVADRSAVLTEVERFHGHFMYLNEELSLIAELLAAQGEGRKRIPDLCSEAKADLRKKRQDLDAFRGRLPPRRAEVRRRGDGPGHDLCPVDRHGDRRPRPLRGGADGRRARRGRRARLRGRSPPDGAVGLQLPRLVRPLGADLRGTGARRLRRVLRHRSRHHRVPCGLRLAHHHGVPSVPGRRSWGAATTEHPVCQCRTRSTPGRFRPR